ncbi:MAG: coenzyme A pyrophosphatase [Cytophaga sp.]|nr:coenzyme A pyrophosphatase [Cytophaga sp.]
MQMMELPVLMDKLKQRLQLALPGIRAHEIMRAVPVAAQLLKFDHTLPPKPGSVLILLYPDQGSIKFPLTKRQTYAGAHSGQISLPGGKREAGETFIETALREAEEEIGINSADVTVVGRLSDFFVIPSNFMVTPVIGYSKVKPVFTADSYEVARILEADLFELISDTAIQSKEITVGSNFKMQAPHFEIEQEIVWGATAMMLNELRMILKEVIH